MVILCRAERFDPRNSNHSKVHTIMQLQGNNGKAWLAWFEVGSSCAGQATGRTYSMASICSQWKTNWQLFQCTIDESVKGAASLRRYGITFDGNIHIWYNTTPILSLTLLFWQKHNSLCALENYKIIKLDWWNLTITYALNNHSLPMRGGGGNIFKC